ncbi:unnamed protein product [Schistosoma margrebowiei]|uniref:Uncharacterized protein n=1 Tax=Schistosoma margrebowiei TaxID=48269 RepID=A0A183LF68_9TREM|nr:unnamed protein product [Schistosoma margrebowiei]
MNKEDLVQGKDSIPTVEERMEIKITVCQPTSNSGSSIRTSIQFYFMELKFGEPPQLSSKMYNYNHQNYEGPNCQNTLPKEDEYHISNSIVSGNSKMIRIDRMNCILI